MPIRPEHIVNLQGRPYVQLPGLLHLAHESGLRSIETELIQIPTAENGNVAIVRAMARFAGEDGDALWSSYGDASPRNVNRMMIEALIRLAETRAIGRVLRWACDVGEALLEELPDDETAGAKHTNGAPGNGQAAVRAPQSPAGAAAGTARRDAAPAAGSGGEEAAVCIYADCGQRLTKNQLTMSQHKLHLKLCPLHLKLMLEEQQKAQGVG